MSWWMGEILRSPLLPLIFIDEETEAQSWNMTPELCFQIPSPFLRVGQILDFKFHWLVNQCEEFQRCEFEGGGGESHQIPKGKLEMYNTYFSVFIPLYQVLDNLAN